LLIQAFSANLPNTRDIRRVAASYKRRIRWVALPSWYQSWACLPLLRNAAGRTDDAGGAGKTMVQVNHLQHSTAARTQSARPVSELLPSWGG